MRNLKAKSKPLNTFSMTQILFLFSMFKIETKQLPLNRFFIYTELFSKRLALRSKKVEIPSKSAESRAYKLSEESIFK